MKALMLAVLTLLPVATVRAQVGYDPLRSPYEDVDYRQELTWFAGAFLPRRDPAGVAPRGGVITGAQYEWRAGGPAYLTGELARIGSTRTVIDTARTAATRVLGDRSTPLYALDLGMALGLTGARSYHHLMPLLKAGVGFVSDFKPKTDSGGFKFGTRFALSWGAAVRWVPGGKWQLRADLTNRLYTIGYPESYYRQPASGGAPVLSSDVARSRWTNNPALTLGISYLFSR